MKRSSTEVVIPAATLFACLGVYLVVVMPRALHGSTVTSLLTSYDVVSYFVPRYWLGSEELANFHLPLWNRFEFGGIPLLATAQPAVLYPPKIIAFGLLGPIPALWAFLVFHYVLTGFGFLGLLHQEGVRGPGLFAGSATWTLGLHLSTANYHPVRIACLAWVPLVFIFAVRIVRGTGSLGSFACVALFVTSALFAGYPEFALDLAVLLAVYASAHALSGGALPASKTIPLLAGAFLLGALAASIVLLPLAELTRVADRAAIADTNATSFERVGPSVHQDWLTLAVQLFLIVPGLTVFAAIGLGLRKLRAPAVCFAVCVVLCCGGWKALRLLPMFRFVRFPLCWWMFAAFFLSWLVGEGADSVVGRDLRASPSERSRLRFAVAFSVGIAVLWVLARATDVGPDALSSTALDFVHRYFETPTTLAFTLATTLGVAGLAIVALRGGALPRWAWMASFASAVAAHVIAHPHGLAPASFAPPFPAGLAASMHGHPRSVTGRVLAPADLAFGYEITDQLPSALGVETSFLPARWRRLVAWLGLVTMNGGLDWTRALQARRFWDAMDVELIVGPSASTRDFVAAGARELTRLGPDVLYANPGRMGYAWVNYAVRRFATEDAAFEYVTSRRFDPDRDVVLTQPTERNYPTVTRDSVTVPSSAKRLSSTEVELDVTLAQPGILVTSESAYPGWIATADGVERPLLVANYVLRALELGPGSHHVRFEYRPASVRWGALLSGFGLAAIAGMLVIAWRRRASEA